LAADSRLPRLHSTPPTTKEFCRSASRFDFLFWLLAETHSAVSDTLTGTERDGKVFVQVQPPNTSPARDAKFKQFYYLVLRPGSSQDVAGLRYTYRKLEEPLALLIGIHLRFSETTLVSKEEPFDAWNTLYFYRDVLLGSKSYRCGLLPICFTTQSSSLLGTSARELGLGRRSLASQVARRISEIGARRQLLWVCQWMS
jgi:hypothetical protein